ncbi:MAG: phosphodiesterase [Planctomycetota bacterium]|nr:MAG: phosphodiesterase [Planctomycetota bacterium]
MTSEQTDRTWPGEPAADFPGVVPRLLILGLDGATFDVLSPMMEAGRMPRLLAAVESGASGTLWSTTPPITPAAWTTFLTGKHPGLHRILDFEGYDVNTGRLRFNSARSIRDTRNLWSILSERGFRVGSINVPLTYPPQPVNGFMISGFDSPGPEAPFAYPADLRGPILERWPDPTSGKNWRRKFLGGEALFRENVAYLMRSFDQSAQMTRWCGERFGWDVLMVVLKLVDNLQHKTWKYIDPRWRDRAPSRRDLVARAFSELDAAIGRVLDYAGEHGAAVMMVSDHGHGSLEGKVYPNALLSRWGYLKVRTPVERAIRAGREKLGRNGRSSASQYAGVERHLPVDLSRSSACVMHAGNAGFLYINLKGRQPGGIVDPSEYERLRDELTERFLAVRWRDPQGGEFRLFPKVHKPEELYGCTRAEEPWLPDLMLIQDDRLAVARRLRGRTVVEWLPYRRLEGTHRFNGMFVACGPGIARGRKVEAHIVDCAPTVLAMLGLRIPEDMQGKVIVGAFERPPRIEKQAVRSAADVAASEHVYAEGELETITTRLSDLGYLE